MKTEFKIEIRSELAAPAARVWDQVRTLAGVNYELLPLVYMTGPRRFRDLPIDEWSDTAPAGERHLFTSWILLGAVLPWDRHYFGLEHVTPGRGFQEHSTSLFMRSWRHERRVEPGPDDTCVVHDTVVFRPRLALMGTLVRPVFAFVFAHRHRRLRRKFGRRPAH